MPRLAPVLALALGAALGAACKKQPQHKPDRHGRDEVVATPASAPAGLPAPHKLSLEPDAALHVTAPAAMLAAAAAYVPQAPGLAELGEQVLATQGPADWARTVGAQLDGQRAWTGAHVEGEDILHFGLQRGGAAKVQAAMAKYPKRGEFGAVALPHAALALQGGELVKATAGGLARLAWVDTTANTLTVASTPQGLATGRTLAGAYGKQPLWFTMVEARGQALLGRFPYGRIAATGTGLHHLDITATARTGQKLPVLREIAPGPLGGALTGKTIAVGASARWTGYKEAVREVTHQLQAAVDRAGFAGKMMLDPIADQATRVLKLWNGRVLFAVGPARHLRLGLGADDPNAAHRGLLTLLRDITENLQLARMFVSNIPNASLKKVGDGPDLWMLTVTGISNQLPPAARTLVDDGRVRIAFHGSAHAGGVLVVVGPRADSELKAWIAEAASAASGKDGMKDLVRATVATSPEAISALLLLLEQVQRAQPGAGDKALAAFLALTADRAATQLVMRQVEQRYEISVRGPEAAKPRR